jgi:hypothetical protein
MGAVTVASAALDTSAIERQYNAERQAGAFIFEVRSGNIYGLDAARCFEFTKVEGVLAGGAVFGQTTVSLASAPGQPVPLLEVTPGTSELAWSGRSDLARSSVVAGQMVADTFGLIADSTVALADGGSLVVDAVAAEPARLGGFDTSLIVTALPLGGERADACMVEAQPGRQLGVRQALLGWFDPADKITVFGLFERGAGAEDPTARLRGRVSARIALGLGAVSAVAFTISWWARRREVSLYRMFGASRRDLLVMVAAEAAVLLLLPSAVGAGGAVLALAPDSLAATTALRDLFRIWAFVALSPLASVALLARVRPWDGVRGL